MQSRLKLPVFAFLAAGALAVHSTASACSCPPTPPMEDRISAADFVFMATIIGLKYLDTGGTEVGETGEKRDVSDFEKVRISFDPHEDFKGDSSRIDFLYTRRSSAACGVTVELGATHVFFVSERNTVGLCGGTLRDRLTAESLDLIRRLAEAERNRNAAGHVPEERREGDDGGT